VEAREVSVSAPPEPETLEWSVWPARERPWAAAVLLASLLVLGVLVGVIQILIAVFKLGDLTRYISESVIIGFMAAAAFLLAAGQLGNALGVHDKGNGHMQVLRRVWLTLTHGDAINYRALILSAGAVVLAVVLRKLVQRYGLPQIDILSLVWTGPLRMSLLTKSIFRQCWLPQ